MSDSNKDNYTNSSNDDDAEDSMSLTDISIDESYTRHSQSVHSEHTFEDTKSSSPSSLQPISFNPPNIVLILTVDGTLHALDTNNRSFLWHTNVDPVLVTTTISNDTTHKSVNELKLKPVVVLGNPRTRKTHSGTLLYYNRTSKQSDKVEPTDETEQTSIAFDIGPMMRVQHLVTHSPIHFPGAQQILLGRRTGRLVSLDLTTGMRKGRDGPNRLVLGRTEYELRAVDEANHSSTQWSLSYAELDGIKQPTPSILNQEQEREMKYSLNGNVMTVNEEWAVRFAETPVQVMKVVQREGGDYYTVQVIDTGTGREEIEKVWIRKEEGNVVYAIIKEDENWFQDKDTDQHNALPSFDEFKVQRAELPFELNSFELDYWQPWLKIDHQQQGDSLLLLPAPEGESYHYQWISTLSVLILSMVVTIQIWRKWRHRYVCNKLRSKEFIPIELVNTQWIPPTILSHSTISVNPNRILGHGSSGCIVMEGRYHNRQCAIKRLPNATKRLDREITELQRVDRHDHVRRLYGHQQVGGYTYMALELADSSLESIMQGTTPLIPMDPISVSFQLIQGVKHLHKHGLVHRDLKPTNVLLIGDRVVVSDLGIALRVEGESQLTVSTGTPGWRAPESSSLEKDEHLLTKASSVEIDILEQQPLMDNVSQKDSQEHFERISNTLLPDASSDIFSLGCLIYYICSGGEHPFGGVVDRERNALNGNIVLKQCEKLSMEDNNLMFTLVTRMTDCDPGKRPSIKEVSANPLFWNASLRLGFLMDLSDWMEQQDRFASLPGILEFNCVRQQGALSSGLITSPDDPTRDWLNIVDKIIWSDLTKYRSYSGRSLVDLLRAIRNKRHHFNELPFFAKRMLGKDGSDQGYWGYFAEKFPRVLGVVYEAAREWGLFEREGRRFAKYHWVDAS